MKNTICLLILCAAIFGSRSNVCAQNAAANKPRATEQKPEKTLSPVEMSEDFAVLKSALVELHPGLYLYNTRAQIDDYFSDLESRIKAPLGEKQFYLLVSQLTAKIKCGHTFLNPLNLDETVAARIFSEETLPFYFVIIDKKIVVTHNYSSETAIRRGDEISEINGVSASKIIDALLTVSRGDGDNSIGKRLANLNLIPEEDYRHALFDIYFPLFFPSADSSRFSIKTKSSNGKTRKYTVASVSPEQRKAAFEREFGAVPKFEKTWDYKLLDAKTARLKFGTFSFWNSDFKWQPYLESVFKDLQSKPNVRNLIIDIRGNEGGNGEIRDAILSYITAKPIAGEYDAKICYRFLTVPDALLKYLSTWDKTFKQPKNESNYALNELGLYQKKAGAASELITPNPNRFAGKVYLLTDAVNSSSTFDMAWTFQANKLGTIVGEPTGGTKRGLNGGQMFFLRLPVSKFEIDLPLIHYYHKGFADEGVTPDFIVRETRADIENGVDKQLKFALELAAE